MTGEASGDVLRHVGTIAVALVSIWCFLEVSVYVEMADSGVIMALSRLSKWWEE